MQMDALASQKIKKSNVQIFDIMGAASLSEIFTAWLHSKKLHEKPRRKQTCPNTCDCLQKRKVNSSKGKAEAAIQK